MFKRSRASRPVRPTKSLIETTRLRPLFDVLEDRNAPSATPWTLTTPPSSYTDPAKMYVVDTPTTDSINTDYSTGSGSGSGSSSDSGSGSGSGSGSTSGSYSSSGSA